MVPNVAHELTYFYAIISMVYSQVKNALYPVLYPAAFMLEVGTEPTSLTYNIRCNHASLSISRIVK